MGQICCSNTPVEKTCLSLYYEIPDQYASKAINTSSFTFTQVLGSGSFGRVFLVYKNDTNERFAMKVINKNKLTAPKKKLNALTERNILANVASPFIVKLHYAFQSSVRLFLVMEYCEGQDLYANIRRNGGRLSETQTQFYAAEVVLALEDLHRNKILYRDLKPENVLLDKEGHIKLTDFNLAKFTHAFATTMCGTPEYIAPEVLQGRPHNFAIDFWGLGVLIYEMLAGYSPFGQMQSSEMYLKILCADYKIPNQFSKYVSDLIRKLVCADPNKRLCSFEDIKQHQFFYGINWEDLREKKVKPPHKPSGSKIWNDLRHDLSSASPGWDSVQKFDNIFEEFTYIGSFAKS